MPVRGDWLAGFIDGEGCFRLQRHPHNGTWHASFTLKQRDDDTALLEAIARETGIGRVKLDRHRSGNSAPCAVWKVESKRDTAALCRLLDEHPLRSRKARDYTLWRSAVVRIATRRRASGWEDIAELADDLTTGRAYREGGDAPCPSITASSTATALWS
jgi:LAGLIDADG DNA endonuclease family protein